jgi:hypothetical protein
MRALLVVVSLAAVARAGEMQIQKPSPTVMPSRHELNVQLGYQAGFGGSLGSPSGVKLSVDYAYRFHPIAWFDVEVANVFGVGGGDGPCVGMLVDQCYRGGHDLQLNVGVKLKFQTRLPLTVEVPLMVGLSGLYGRNCGDNGVALPVTRGGARLKYWVTRRLAVGVGATLAFGPAYHERGSTVCAQGTYTDYYGAFDIMGGAELLL